LPFDENYALIKCLTQFLFELIEVPVHRGNWCCENKKWKIPIYFQRRWITWIAQGTGTRLLAGLLASRWSEQLKSFLNTG
jgi:hypothetical protein